MKKLHIRCKRPLTAMPGVTPTLWITLGIVIQLVSGCSETNFTAKSTTRVPPKSPPTVQAGDASPKVEPKKNEPLKDSNSNDQPQEPAPKDASDSKDSEVPAPINTLEPTIESHTQEFTIEANKGEVFFVLDTSTSMEDELGYLEDNVNSFVDQFSNQATVNFHILMEKGVARFPNDLDIELENYPVDSHDALKVTARYIEDRDFDEKSRKDFIFITDDNAQKYMSHDFINLLQSTKELATTTSIHAIVWQDGISTGSRTCTKAAEGGEYIKLAKHPVFGGKLIDICSHDWQTELKDLGALVSSKTIPKFVLDHPAHPDSIKVLIDNITLDEVSIHYDEQTRTVTLGDMDLVLEDGDTLRIVYESDE